MPTYDYHCEACNYIFEESFKKVDESSLPSPCPKCQAPSGRAFVNAPYVARAGSSRDSVDMVLGAESEKRWDGINTRKAEKDKLRKESGNQAVGTSFAKEDGQIKYKYSSVSKERIEERKQLYSEFEKSDKKKVE